jgi:hypothetical protein
MPAPTELRLSPVKSVNYTETSSCGARRLQWGISVIHLVNSGVVTSPQETALVDRMSPANRVFHFQLIFSTLCFSWLAMQAVHEFGHVVHAWASAGRVERVVLHPLEISRTDVAPNPHPQFVAWGGPLWGSLIPLGVHLVLLRCQWPRAWLTASFAGFCLVANGAYLLGGSLFPVGDAQTLLDNGAPRLTLVSLGIAGLASGLYLWNGLGRHFGLGKPVAPPDRSAAWGISACAVVLLIAELLCVII